MFCCRRFHGKIVKKGALAVLHFDVTKLPIHHSRGFSGSAIGITFPFGIQAVNRTHNLSVKVSYRIKYVGTSFFQHRPAAFTLRWITYRQIYGAKFSGTV